MTVTDILHKLTDHPIDPDLSAEEDALLVDYIQRPSHRPQWLADFVLAEVRSHRRVSERTALKQGLIAARDRCHD
jgi:hypothetical protein